MILFKCYSFFITLKVSNLCSHKQQLNLIVQVMRIVIKESHLKRLSTSILFFVLFFGFQSEAFSTNKILYDTIGYNSYKGVVIDASTKKKLEFASIAVNETNISTIANSDGGFLLKVPKNINNASILVSFLGYTSQIINLADLNKDNNVISLETYIEELSEVNLVMKDAPTLIRAMLRKRGENYFSDHTTQIGFYRETIKKRRSYVSLSEAIVIINKQPYMSSKSDVLQLHKSRKSTDYDKLDTVALKHRGGPHSMVHLDIMRKPQMLLTEEIFENYRFTFDTSTKIDNRVIYVVNFKGRPGADQVLFYGKFYIDAKSLALTSAKFQLDLSNKNKASQFFIHSKPSRASVTPIEAAYHSDYKVKDGKWYHSYSRIQLGFKINWDKKLFNSIYYSTIEMAVTDWYKSESKKAIKMKDRLKSSVILSDEASGFSDPEFWGEFNLIEPEKPIESAIEKIQKELIKINN